MRKYYYILNFEMTCNVKTSKDPKVLLEFLLCWNYIFEMQCKEKIYKYY